MRARRAFPIMLVLMVLAACSGAQPPAAVVNGERITDHQVRTTVPMFEFLSKLSNTACGQTSQTPPAPGDAADKACARFALGFLIQEDVVKAYARENSVSASPAQIDAALAQVSGPAGGEAQFNQILADDGVTPAEFRAFAGRLVLFQEVQLAVGQDQVDEAELRRAYQDRLTEFTTLHAAHILVKTQPEAAAIARRATPANFAALARQFSTDPGSAKKGGDLGQTPASSLVPEFANAALEAKPGEIVGPVQSQFGWHVIRVIGSDVVPFAQARDQLAGPLTNELFANWLVDRIEEADVEVNPRYGRLNEDGRIVPITSTAEETTQASP
ncbi:MAG: peptidylprolyl isomerase [Actinomycetota bacterium]